MSYVTYNGKMIQTSGKYSIYSSPPALLKDKDGNIYNTVTIGSQIWTIENYRTTTYANGTPIPNGASNWSTFTNGAYCEYDNSTGLYVNDYGYLYNGFTIDNSNGFVFFEMGGVPDLNWRIPSVNDASILASFVGGQATAGGAMKEVGLAHWLTPNTGATDAYGFKAVGGAYRPFNGIYTTLKQQCYFYFSNINAGNRNFGFINFNATFFTHVGQSVNRYPGYSIRCVKDA